MTQNIEERITILLKLQKSTTEELEYLKEDYIKYSGPNNLKFENNKLQIYDSMSSSFILLNKSLLIKNLEEILSANKINDLIKNRRVQKYKKGYVVSP